MSAFSTRTAIAAGADFYLTPLAHLKDEPELLEELLAPWVEQEEEMERIFLTEDLVPTRTPSWPLGMVLKSAEPKRPK